MKVSENAKDDPGDIVRLAPSAPGRSHGVAFGNLVWVTATSPQKDGDIQTQTRAALDILEHSLEKLGSDKTRLLSVSIHLSDISEKHAMDEVWLAWIGLDANHWAQRTCVQAPLFGKVRVEFAAVAARNVSS